MYYGATVSFMCPVIQKDEEGQVLRKRKSPCDTIPIIDKSDSRTMRRK
jgi:hypothetical protein